jgi:hypothetical protein
MINKMIEQVYQRILALLLGIHANLWILVEINEIGNSILFNWELNGNEIINIFILFCSLLDKLGNVLIILFLSLALDWKSITKDEIFPLALKVLYWNVFDKRLLCELLIIN